MAAADSGDTTYQHTVAHASSLDKTGHSVLGLANEKPALQRLLQRVTRMREWPGPGQTRCLLRLGP